MVVILIHIWSIFINLAYQTILNHFPEMKKLVLLFLFFITSISLIAQDAIGAGFKPAPEKRASVTVGFLHGGGSLIGADFEFLVTPKVGLQAGAGFVGFGAGLNYHLRPAINSSFVSLTYWHQGIGDTFAQDAVGGVFTFRANKLLSASLGLGIPLSRGPALDVDFEQPPVMLLYSIGIYFPL